MTGVEPETVGRALGRGTKRLRATGSGAVDARRLMTFATGWEGAALIVHRDDVVDEDELAIFDAALARREAGEPIAYIVGNAGFYGRSFAVTPAVLVPRPESEHVAEAAVAELHSRAPEQRRAADIGTGSGILAITLACEVTEARGIAVDASGAALWVARENAAALRVEERVSFLAGDLLEPAEALGPFDCIVANLPYVPTAELEPAPDPTSFEPRIALDGGPDGLDLYRRLLARAPAALRPGGAAFFEAGPATCGRLAALAASAFGPAATVAIHRDYAGLERTVAVSMP